MPEGPWAPGEVAGRPFGAGGRRHASVAGGELVAPARASTAGGNSRWSRAWSAEGRSEGRRPPPPREHRPSARRHLRRRPVGAPQGGGRRGALEAAPRQAGSHKLWEGENRCFPAAGEGGDSGRDGAGQTGKLPRRAGGIPETARCPKERSHCDPRSEGAGNGMRTEPASLAGF